MTRRVYGMATLTLFLREKNQNSQVCLSWPNVVNLDGYVDVDVFHPPLNIYKQKQRVEFGQQNLHRKLHNIMYENKFSRYVGRSFIPSIQNFAHYFLQIIPVQLGVMRLAWQI